MFLLFACAPPLPLDDARAKGTDSGGTPALFSSFDVLRYDTYSTELGRIDLNGDGYQDILIYDYEDELYYSAQGSETGLALYDTLTPDSTVWNMEPHAAGDVNGDGYGDFGAADWDEGYGEIQMYFGDALALPESVGQIVSGTSRVWCYEGPYPVGDVNADGYDDVAVMCNRDGDVRVWAGSPTGIGAPLGRLYVGAAVTDIVGGDFNGDGYADVAVGSGFADGSVGAVWVFRGTPMGVSGTGHKIPYPRTTCHTGVPCAAYFGYSLASVGDLDGDGADELGAWALGEEYVYVFPGQSPWPLGNRYHLFANGGATFGYHVAPGDFNGDGRIDLAAWGYPGAYALQPAVGWPISYPFAETEIAVTPLSPEGYVYPLSGLGDVNGDGYDDISAFYQDGSTSSPDAVVYYGGP